VVNVDTASNGFEALEKLHSQKFDAVVSDVERPEMGGVELLQAMKSDDALQAIPVVMMSGNSEPKDRKQVMDLGALGLLEKPFPYTDLIQILSHAFLSAVATEVSATREDAVPGTRPLTPAP
jgi:two-component system chemotaxis response regulator CheY